jgi:hypothetical protein
MVQKPVKIQGKNSKKYAIYPGTKSPFLGLQLVPGTTIQKEYFLT